MGDSVRDDRAESGVSEERTEGYGLFLIPAEWKGPILHGDEGRWKLEIGHERWIFLSDEHAKSLSVNDEVLLPEKTYKVTVELTEAELHERSTLGHLSSSQWDNLAPLNTPGERLASSAQKFTEACMAVEEGR